MTCTCKPCPLCNTAGIVIPSQDGEPLGRLRLYDLEDMALCRKCDGTGYLEICGDCLSGSIDETCGPDF